MSLIDPMAPSFRRPVSPAQSLRKFGLTMGGACAAISTLQGWRHHSWYAFAGIAGLFAVLAVVAPRVLAPVSSLWMRLGAALGRVTSFLILALSYFLVIVPIGLLLKILRRDILHLKRGSGESFWNEVDPAGPSGRSREPY